jgi:acyl-CoA synthetase (AMP-forming)/AMP-acid ligase II
MDILIADRDSLVVADDGIVGEIFVQGVGLAKKYWNNVEASLAFNHQVIGREGRWYIPRSHFRYATGDLGYIKNGSLYVTGRLKDVIIETVKIFMVYVLANP